jgi:hypothetical protein
VAAYEEMSCEERAAALDAVVKEHSWENTPLEGALPCPFCGGEPTGSRTGTLWVRCEECGCDGEAPSPEEHAYEELPELALANWNRRANRGEKVREPDFEAEAVAFAVRVKVPGAGNLSAPGRRMRDGRELSSCVWNHAALVHLLRRIWTVAIARADQRRRVPLDTSTEELLRAVRDWSDNDNVAAPEIIEALGPWVEAGCPDVDRGRYCPENQRAVYIIDDGGTYHWVSASSEEDALAVWREHMIGDCGMTEDEVNEHDRQPTAKRCTPKEAASARFTDGPPDTMWGEFARDSSRRHIACSEY